MKILAVDDEFVALTKMLAVLQDYGQCDAATNGAQALELFTEAMARGEPYQLVTLDIEMPAMSGIEVLRTMRQREQLRMAGLAKIIMVSAASSRTNVVDAGKHSCDAFLVKPVAREALIAALCKLGLVEPPKPAPVEPTEEKHPARRRRRNPYAEIKPAS